jgi:hypothetical protein
LGDVAPQEIWIIGVDGRSARRLASSIRPRPPEIMSWRGDLHNLVFSIDSRALFFQSGCSAVRFCINKVDVRSGHARTFHNLGATRMEILGSGRHAGYLLVQQHQYYPQSEGGSYEELWLVSPDGKPVRDLGPGDLKYDDTVRRFREADALLAEGLHN